MHRSALYLLALTTIALLILSSCVSFAAVFVKWDSPGPTFDGDSWATAYHTVQAGIDDADIANEEVWVSGDSSHPYVENIVLRDGVALFGGFAGTETSRGQRNWATNVTILDGNQAGCVVTSPSGATSSTVIDGFTIRNGRSDYGGGVFCSESSPTITHNVIEMNASTWDAGAVFLTESSPLIQQNVIRNNTAAHNGGGIWSTFGSNPQITDNVIAGNVASSQGGGLVCWYSAAIVTNNTFVGNSALNAGAILVADPSTPSISNNVIALNSSGIVAGGAGIPALSHNCLYGNPGGDYVGLSPGGGDISADPIFKDAGGGDFHIRACSPCRNAGDDLASGLPALDMDGQNRIEGSAVDIGADESYGEVYPSLILRVKAGSPNDGPGNDWDHAWHTISNAMKYATVNDEVWVASGTYVENITLKDGVGLYGGFAGTESSRNQRNPAVNVTVLDGNQANSVVRVVAGAGLSTVIDGFTVRNGNATYGGGIYCSSASPTISGNTIRDNTASWAGGGLYCGDSATPLISENTITGNIATGSAYSSGGGIGCWGQSGPAITGNTITDNQANGTDWSDGGGIYCSNNSNPTITSNTIARNYAKEGGGISCRESSPTISGNSIVSNNAGPGGGIWCGGPCSPTISENVIRNNTADEGAGIFSWSHTSPLIQNNVITGNTATGCGGGINVGDGSMPAIANNTIVGNDASTCGGGIVLFSSTASVANNIVAFCSSGISKDESSSVSLSHNCVYGNTAYNYSGLSPGTGDISADPLFVDRAGGHYHIRAYSPCRNAGDDLASGLPALDMDGQNRIEGSAVDIGADESYGEVYPSLILRVKAGSPNDGPGNDWDHAWHTISNAMKYATVNDEVWVASGTYVENITLKSGVGLYGGFAGTETARDQRNRTTNVTILDGNQAGSVVTSPSGATSSTVIDGFTIRNGGDGISCYRSSPTISRNNITTNHGAGVLCYDQSSPTISENTISGNTSQYGSGVFCQLGSSPRITSNTITDNVQTGGSNGGGVLCVDSCSAIISGNVIMRNSAGFGAGVCCHSNSPAVISNNVIANNTASSHGGGLFIYASAATITGNIISANTAPNGSGIQSSQASPVITSNTVVGNGPSDQISCYLSSPTIANNIIAFGVIGVSKGSGSAPSLSHNCVYGNTAYNYSGLSPGTGDISADPLFVDRAGGDYHITSGSPCFNTGDNSAPGLPATDMDGEPRILMGTVDIGAYECCPPIVNIAQAKALPTDSWVTVNGSVITVVVSPMQFYIETDDRSCGTMVYKPAHGMSVGMRANITGTVRTGTTGEKYINATSVSQNGTGTIEPIWMTNRVVGGGDSEDYNASTGAGQKGVKNEPGLYIGDLNNIGLLIAVFGKVTYSTSGYFYVDDGSKCKDNSTHDGVKVLGTVPDPSPVGKFVKVTGASSCFKATSPSTDLYRQIRATQVVVLQ